MGGVLNSRTKSVKRGTRSSAFLTCTRRNAECGGPVAPFRKRPLVVDNVSLFSVFLMNSPVLSSPRDETKEKRVVTMIV